MPPQLPQEVEMESTNWNTLEKDKSLLKPDRCRRTAHHQRVSLFTSANSSDNPANDSESPKAPSTIFNLYYTVLYTTLRTQLYTQLYSTQLYSTQLQPIIRYSVPSLRQGRRPHRSVGSTPRISPPEGWRMEPRTQIHLEKEESW